VELCTTQENYHAEALRDIVINHSAAAVQSIFPERREALKGHALDGELHHCLGKPLESYIVALWGCQQNFSPLLTFIEARHSVAGIKCLHPSTIQQAMKWYRPLCDFYGLFRPWGYTSIPAVRIHVPYAVLVPTSIWGKSIKGLPQVGREQFDASLLAFWILQAVRVHRCRLWQTPMLIDALRQALPLHCCPTLILWLVAISACTDVVRPLQILFPWGQRFITL